MTASPDEGGAGGREPAANGGPEVPALLGWSDSSAVARWLAKGIDLLVFVLLALILGGYGVIAGLLYLLLGDGIIGGRSLGKWAVGLQVRRMHDARFAGPIEALLRNAPLVLPLALAVIPLVGWVVFVFAGAPLLVVETVLVVRSHNGMRAGDHLAQTRVVDAPRTPVFGGEA